MMLNMPILGVICEPTPSSVKKFEYFKSTNVTRSSFVQSFFIASLIANKNIFAEPDTLESSK